MLGRLPLLFLLLVLFCLQGCEGEIWNDPYPQYGEKENVLFTAFSERPKHLDPAVSYNANEWILINQICEPPLQYDYLKRPYELVPLVAKELPSIQYYTQDDRPTTENDKNIAYTIYRIQIQPGIFYQMHPAFAKKEGTEHFLYHDLPESQLKNKHSLKDFKEKATRELIADDFVYQIKRLADPTLNSPIFGLMENYIVGLKELNADLQKAYTSQKAKSDNFLDLRPFQFNGAKTIDRYTYEIKVKGKYPQFSYWLAMPFFAPMPWEAVKFHSQQKLLEKNISLDWFPIGTGPFFLSENNPNLQMVLEKNPTFHGERYPSKGEPGDEALGLLQKADQPLPFLDKIVFVLEKEDIPYWNKFLQGYYDQSGVSSDNFDQAIRTVGTGNLELADALQHKGIRLSTSIQPSVFYWGFNMLDETVGGYSAKQRKLRQAIAMAIDMEEYINIFLNSNAISAHSPIAPGIFGYQEGVTGINPFVYEAHGKAIQRQSIDQAKKLLAEAGYPNGIDPKTQQPLVLYYDAIISGGSEAQPEFAWLRKQFKKLNIDLVVRATQYNRFQDKMRNGDAQIFFWGWNADYPDPENFLFLLYSKNSMVKADGENATNYANPSFDSLYEKMKSMPNGPERMAMIQQMNSLFQADSPWIGGFYPKVYTLRQGWVAPFKSNAMSRNTLKYMSIDPAQRAIKRKEWNRPILWPLAFLLLGSILLCIPASIFYWQKMYRRHALPAAKPLKGE